jgi:uncharacterized membrane protein YkvA (DUF1232 family)
MDSNDIRKQIEDALAHEQRTGDTAKLLAQYCANRGLNMSAAQQSDCLDFIKAYIRETPALMDVAYNAAQQAALLARFQPIFDAAFSYWFAYYDFIPDTHGLVGIADDSYLTRMLLESVSGIHLQQTGQPLLSIDLGPANRLMRGLIGEPIASQLDGLVGQTVAGQVISSNLQQLMNFGQLNLTMPSYGGYMNQYQIDREVDIRLGAMGIF